MKVNEAAGGKEALDLLKNEPGFDLIILDYQMPDMDGLSLARAIKNAKPEVTAKMIILLSGGGIPADKLTELNISTTLSKPIKQSKLIDVIISTLFPDNRQEEHQHLTKVFNQPEISHEIFTPISPREINLPSTTQKHHILVVEDNPANQLLARRILERAGYEVDIAAHGKIALEHMVSQQYSLVLMDIQMPIMDGFAATHAIREWEAEHQAQRTPIIALTAHAVEGYKEQCIEKGMDDYITKPIKKKILLSCIQQWLKTRRAVLIVDDTNEDRLLIEKFIERDINAQIMFATNGKEALEIILQCPPMLILLDMEMPIMDGYETAEQIRAMSDETYKNLPIIALTAHEGDSEIKKCFDSGCTSYLAKPIRRQLLLDMIMPYLGKTMVAE